jgi:preprotein translocase subunit SecE
VGSIPTARAKFKIMDRIQLYLKESYNELVNKVTWPTWPKLLQDSRLVLVASLILSLIIFLMDMAAQGVLGLIYPESGIN